MTAGGTLVGDAVLVQFLSQVLHLADTGVEHVELGVLLEADSQCCHISSVHTTIGNEALEGDAELFAAFVPLGFVGSDETTHVHETVFLSRHGHRVHIREHLAGDLLDGFVGVAFLARLDEIGVLGEASRVHIYGHTVFVAEFGGGFDVSHRDGLTTDGVVGDGQYHERHVALVLAEHFLQFLERDVALEGSLELGVFGIVAGDVNSRGFAGFDMTFGGVEVCIAGDDLTGLNEVREEHVLGCATLVSRDDVVEAGEACNGLFELKEGAGA